MIGGKLGSRPLCEELGSRLIDCGDRPGYAVRRPHLKVQQFPSSTKRQIRGAARLAGEFAVATFEPGEQRLILARDSVGSRPLYYWRGAKCLVFASEIKAIIARPEVAAEPNLDLLADSLLLDHIPYEDDGETFFSGIWRVMPGNMLVVAPGSLSTETF